MNILRLALAYVENNDNKTLGQETFLWHGHKAIMKYEFLGSYQLHTTFITMILDEQLPTTTTHY